MALHLTATGRVTDKFKSDLGRLLLVPQPQAEALIGYLLDSKNPLPEAPTDFARIAVAVGIPETEVFSYVSVLRYVLSNWKRVGFTLDELVSDFRELGYSSEQVQAGQYLFSTLEPLKEAFFASTRRTSEEMIGAPTVDNVSMSWNLRPVFASPAFTGSGNDDELFIEWVSHTYLLSLEFNTSRSDGKQESSSFQMTESDFDSLERGLARARKQLELLKSKRLI